MKPEQDLLDFTDEDVDIITDRFASAASLLNTLDASQKASPSQSAENT